jgi:Transposase domain (DUF772)
MLGPIVFFKLQLVMFLKGIRSERKLVETASLNLAHRWYLGYALDEELPDHSSLTRIRCAAGAYPVWINRMPTRTAELGKGRFSTRRAFVRARNRRFSGVLVRQRAKGERY